MWLLLVILAIVALHVFAIGNAHVADDHFFAHALDRQTLAQFVAVRYAGWSGRVPIEVALVLLINHPWLWKLLNGLMVLLLCYSAGRVSLARTSLSAAASTALAFALFMLISPAIVYEAAWWMTGSVNYLWPVALGLFGLLAFVDVSPLDRRAPGVREPRKTPFSRHSRAGGNPWTLQFNGLTSLDSRLRGNDSLGAGLLEAPVQLRTHGPKEHGPLARLSFLLASGLAMYNEQVALVLLPAALVLLGLRIARREWRGWDLAHVGFMTVNALVVFGAPGSQRRYLSEQALRFPDFATLDVMDNLAIGFGLVLRSAIDPQNLLIALLIAVGGALVLRSPVGKLAKLVIVLALAYLALDYLLTMPGMADGSVRRSFYMVPRLDGGSASSSRAYALSAWSAFCFACLMGACILALWRSRRECWTAALTLLLGLASLGAMGFSPTAYASGSRVAFICQIAFLLVGARLVVALQEEWPPRVGKAVFVVIALAASYRVLRPLL